MLRYHVNRTVSYVLFWHIEIIHNIIKVLTSYIYNNHLHMQQHFILRRGKGYVFETSSSVFRELLIIKNK